MAIIWILIIPFSYEDLIQVREDQRSGTRGRVAPSAVVGKSLGVMTTWSAVRILGPSLCPDHAAGCPLKTSRLSIDRVIRSQFCFVFFVFFGHSFLSDLAWSSLLLLERVYLELIHPNPILDGELWHWLRQADLRVYPSFKVEFACCRRQMQIKQLLPLVWITCCLWEELAALSGLFWSLDFLVAA